MLTADQLSLAKALKSDQTAVYRGQHAVPLEDFQVFGERSSGTNALAKLISSNTTLTEVRNYGWKHGFPVSLAYSPKSLIVLVVRDPIDWCVSMFNNPHAVHRDVDTQNFSNFIRGEWAMMVRPKVRMWWIKPWRMTVRQDVGGMECVFDRHPITGDRFATIFEMRYAKLAAMMSMQRRNANFLLARYESVMRQPEVFLDVLRNEVAVEVADTFEPLPDHSLNPKLRRPRPVFGRNQIDARDADFICSQLDMGVETAFGYESSVAQMQT